jgi:hypothetical protein
LIIICSLPAWQVLSWGFSANKDSPNICGTKHHFLESWPHWGSNSCPTQDSPFPSSLTPSPTSSWCYTGISCPFIRSRLQECSLYLILLTWLRYVTWWGDGGLLGNWVQNVERAYKRLFSSPGYIDEEIKTPRK